MKTLAYSPRHWERYLVLLSNPLARLVDLLAIKQGEKIARQKGWVKPKRAPAASRRKAATGKTDKQARRRRAGAPSILQPLLFPELETPVRRTRLLSRLFGLEPGL
jgi:hypothetical protein